MVFQVFENGRIVGSPDASLQILQRFQRRIEFKNPIYQGNRAIRFSLWLMKWEIPTSVTGRMLTSQGRSDSPDAVPLEFSGELFFKDGISANFYCSFITENQQWMHVSGTKGYLKFDDFVLPFYGPETAFEVSNLVFNVSGCKFNMENHTRRFAIPEYSNSTPNSQETNLYRNFAAQVLTGSINNEWPDSALKTQTVMETCLQSAREGSKQISLNQR